MNTKNKVQEFMIKELSHQLECKKSNEFMFWLVVCGLAVCVGAKIIGV